MKATLHLQFINSEQFRLWFLQDKIFRSPKAELNLRFKLPVLNGSVENVAKTELFVALLLDQLNEYAHPARLAGLHYHIDANSRGFDVNVSGYTDRQSLLVNKIVEAIAKANFTESRFDKIKEDLMREWRNEDKEFPYDVVINKISRLQYMPSWTTPEYAEGLKKATFEQFKPYAAELLRGAKIEALFYGNLYSQDAIKLAALIDHQLLQKRSSRIPQMAKVIRVENKENKSWLYVNPGYQNDHV
ncbi:MAG: peptidase M16, partial [Chitinophagaceae bacterium]